MEDLWIYIIILAVAIICLLIRKGISVAARKKAHAEIEGLKKVIRERDERIAYLEKAIRSQLELKRLVAEKNRRIKELEQVVHNLERLSDEYLEQKLELQYNRKRGTISKAELKRRKESDLAWIYASGETSEKVNRCRFCGHPAIPGTDYCYQCSQGIY